MSTRIIGPFLGPRGTSGISICIGLPDHTMDTLTCKLICQNQLEKECQSRPQYSCFRLFQFEFENLDSRKIYNYKFSYMDETGQSKDLDLGEGLIYQDCQFKVLGDNKADSFVLLSCNNPFETEKGSADNGWAVWEQLESFLKKDSSVRLIVLGGDQVYNDDLEKFINSDKNKKTGLSNEETKKNLKDSLISQYQKYWGHKSYRKIFASVPSVVMWDDHDITDGWGSRPESFDNKSETGFKDNWWEYFKTTREAFAAYQTSRNNERINNVPENVFSSFLDWGESRFILCDFRSERNSQKNILWSKKHKEAVFDFIKNSPEQIKKIFFLTPVVPLRTNFSGDKRLSQFSLLFFKLRRHIKKDKPWYILQNKWWWLLPLFGFLSPMIASCFPNCFINISDVLFSIKSIAYILFSTIFPFIGVLAFLSLIISYLIKFIGNIKEIPDLSDDLEDGLSSESNRESLKEILDVLTETIKEKNKEIFILSGDIHLGGLTEIIDTRDEKKTSILQIVSSPIAYKPMPKVVEGLTTTTSELILREKTDNERLFARNIFYVSKRNFAQIIPDKMNEGKGIRFFLEGHQFPLVFPRRFYER